jgi:histidinol-phosphate aminotransferase
MTNPRKSLLNPQLKRPSALDSVPRDENRLWLDKNENLDPELMKITRNILYKMSSISLSTYPEAGGVYRKLADWCDVNADQLLLTPGSDGAIRLVYESFVEPGDYVSFPSPTFAMYPIYAQMFGANVNPIIYNSSDSGPFLDSDFIINSILKLKPKLLCLANPDSPTGAVLEPDVLKKILIACESVDTLLLIDEAYHPFYNWTALPWTKSSQNLIVVRTFAKAWGLAGLRVGYAVAHPKTIKLLHKMKPMYEVSTFAVDFMEKMLDLDHEMLKSVKRIQEGKEFFSESMKLLGFKVIETSGNFIHIAFGRKKNIVHTALNGKVYYREFFNDPCLSEYSRFSVAPIEIMTKVSDLIKISILGK